MGNHGTPAETEQGGGYKAAVLLCNLPFTSNSKSPLKASQASSHSQPFIMHLSNLFALALAATAMAAPASDAATPALEKRQDRGSYTVGGLGSRKQAILNAGGNTLDLAIAMLEDERMSTGYAYGMEPTPSVTPDPERCQYLPGLFAPESTPNWKLINTHFQGDNKSGDAANFGVFKQNWGMLRVCGSRAGFQGQSTSQWNNGAKLK
jgi:hypothetical protein